MGTLSGHTHQQWGLQVSQWELRQRSFLSRRVVSSSPWCLNTGGAIFTKCVRAGPGGSGLPPSMSEKGCGVGLAASKHRHPTRFPPTLSSSAPRGTWPCCCLAGVGQERGPVPWVTHTGHDSAVQFTEHLCSLRCWDLLSDSSSLDPPWGSCPTDVRPSNAV